MAVDVKITLQTMGPLPVNGAVAEILLSSSSMLAMVLSPPRTGTSSPSLPTIAELGKELQRLLVPLYQEAGEADDSIAITMDLSFLESMATCVREM